MTGKVERALISVYDKTGIVDFAKALAELGVEILSTGGTARALREGGVEVKDVSEFTGHPEMMDGRVKTLHPTVHGGILARRDVPEHMAALEEHGNGRIDLVAVNLYPFEETIANEDATFEECIEQIDIGGPAMVRSAAKNHRDVLIVTRPEQQEAVLEAIRTDAITPELRQSLAHDAYATTAHYDRAITRWLAGKKPLPTLDKGNAGASGGLGLEKAGRLLHGDNPWQGADLFLTGSDREPCAVRARAVGKARPTALRDLVDLDVALELAKQLADPVAVLVRHGVPIAAAIGVSAAAAIARVAASPHLVAGAALALNRPFGSGCVEAFRAKTDLARAIIAPGVDEKAATALIGDDGPVFLEVAEYEGRGRDADHADIRRIVGGLVIQQRDLGLLGDEEPVVAAGEIGAKKRRDPYFAFACAKHAPSCAVALVKDGAMLGIGCGRPDVAGALDLALREAGEGAEGMALGFDAPLGAADAPLLARAAKAGVKTVILPTGGESDEAVVAAAGEAGLVLLIAGFSHLR